MQGEVPISWGEATHRMNPAAHTGLETGKCRSTLELLQLWLQPSPPGWGPEPCLPPASKPARASEPGPAWPEHVHSLAGCWLRESGSSLCLKAVKINLFLKSSPQTALAPPPCWLLLGLGRPGFPKHPCGLELEHEDAAEGSAAWLHAGSTGVWQCCPPCQAASCSLWVFGAGGSY